MASSQRPSGIAVGRAALLLAGYAGVVGGLGWATSDAWDRVQRPGPAGFDALLAVFAAAGAWLCLAWLTVGFAVTALTALPNAAGRWCAAASPRIAPAAVRRLAGVAIGAAIVSGNAAVSTPAVYAALSPAVPTASTGALPDLDRPLAESVPRAQASPGHSPGPTARSAAVHLVTSARRAERQIAEVVVRRGDTLWGIAASHLPADACEAEVAAQWPRWYEANRHVIGKDPDLIRPGQRLRAPAPASTAEEAR